MFWQKGPRCQICLGILDETKLNSFSFICSFVLLSRSCDFPRKQHDRQHLPNFFEHGTFFSPRSNCQFSRLEFQRPHEHCPRQLCQAPWSFLPPVCLSFHFHNLFLQPGFWRETLVPQEDPSSAQQDFCKWYRFRRVMNLDLICKWKSLHSFVAYTKAQTSKLPGFKSN